MLLLSLPAVAIGDCVQSYSDCGDENRLGITEFALATTAGNSGDRPGFTLWIIGVLTLTGIAVGLVIRFSQGHAGPDPACEPLIGAPVPPSALPGLIVALILGLAGGVSLGPEHLIMTVNIALAVAIGSSVVSSRWSGLFCLTRNHRASWPPVAEWSS